MVEAESHKPNQQPEGISAYQQERFTQLQTDILGRLKPRSFTIVLSSNETNPPDGYNLSLSKEGYWSIDFGKEEIKYLNGPNKPPDKPLESLRRPPDHPEEPVELVEILKEYAFIQNSSRFDEMVRPGEILKNAPRRRDEIRKLEKSVEDNPGPFAESFLRHMENTLKQLSRE